MNIGSNIIIININNIFININIIIIIIAHRIPLQNGFGFLGKIILPTTRYQGQVYGTGFRHI